MIVLTRHRWSRLLWLLNRYQQSFLIRIDPRCEWSSFETMHQTGKGERERDRKEKKPNLNTGRKKKQGERKSIEQHMYKREEEEDLLVSLLKNQTNATVFFVFLGLIIIIIEEARVVSPLSLFLSGLFIFVEMKNSFFSNANVNRKIETSNQQEVRWKDSNGNKQIRIRCWSFFSSDN